MASALHPLLCAALRSTRRHGDRPHRPLGKGAHDDATTCSLRATSLSPPLRLVESGLLVSSPGAPPQPLHTDTDLVHRPSEAGAIKLQLASRRITPAMGPIEVVPGSTDVPPSRAEDASPLSLPVPAGAAIIYDSALWHRGGANRARKSERRVYYVTLLDAVGHPPAGLPYTIEPAEAACFALGSNGVELLQSSAKSRPGCHGASLVEDSSTVMSKDASDT